MLLKIHINSSVKLQVYSSNVIVHSKQVSTYFCPKIRNFHMDGGTWFKSLLDISNAFLHGEIQEEVYMEQPIGFIDPGFP